MSMNREQNRELSAFQKVIIGNTIVQDSYIVMLTVVCKWMYTGAVLAQKNWGGQLRASHHRLGRHLEPHPKITTPFDCHTQFNARK